LDSWQLQHLGQVQKVSETLENSLLHKFTHFDLSLSIARVDLPQQSLEFTPQMVAESGRCQWIEREQLGKYGLPTPIQKILSLYL
jgi:adenine-specific DNA glycosylase